MTNNYSCSSCLNSSVLSNFLAYNLGVCPCLPNCPHLLLLDFAFSVLDFSLFLSLRAFCCTCRWKTLLFRRYEKTSEILLTDPSPPFSWVFVSLPSSFHPHSSLPPFRHAVVSPSPPFNRQILLYDHTPAVEMDFQTPHSTPHLQKNETHSCGGKKPERDTPFFPSLTEHFLEKLRPAKAAV